MQSQISEAELDKWERWLVNMNIVLMDPADVKRLIAEVRRLRKQAT